MYERWGAHAQPKDSTVISLLSRVENKSDNRLDWPFVSTHNTRTLTIAWAVGLSAIAVILSQAVGSALTAVSVWRLEPHEAGTVAVNPMVLSLAVAFGFGLVTWIILNRYLSDRSWLDALALRGLTGREIAYAILGGTMLQFPLAELSNLVEEFVPIAL